MSLAGFQNYTQPLVLNGETTIKRDLNCKNIYVSGTITGSGIDTNILGTNNAWTGTNDCQNVVSYTGSASVLATDLIQKENVDTGVANYNPLVTNNEWTEIATFSNLIPPVVPTFGPGLAPASLYSFDSLQNYKVNEPSTILDNVNTFTGTNNFFNSMQVNNINPSLVIPTLPNQAVTKAYVNALIQRAGGTTTFTIATPGPYSFTNISKNNIRKIDYWLFGGACAGFSGAVVSGTIGNGGGSNGSLLLNIGDIASSFVKFTSPITATSTTSLSVSGQIVGAAGGACNLNGVVAGGQIISPAFNGQYGVSCPGSNANNFLSTISPILGTTSSVGGAIFTVYYV